MKASFVIYFHSSRVDNLKQTLRFLEAREMGLYGSEIVLVCHDSCENLCSDRFVFVHINMHKDTYNKALFCNYGISKAKHDVIILLDSDRILPDNYFSKNVSSIKEKQFITTRYLLSLVNDHSDNEINCGNFNTVDDNRSPANVGRHKNLFSGNTIFYKKDYISSGGMDEEYIGYGYCDNDMTQNILSQGYDVVYNRDKELHLKHTREIYWESSSLRNFKIFSAINAIRFFKKWHLQFDRESSILIDEVRRNLSIYPDVLIERFNEVNNIKFI